MLRRSLCALAAIAGLSIGSTAQAQPPLGYRHYPAYRSHVIHGAARVYYRGCAAEPWRVYATYASDWQAHSAARHLQARGLEALVRGC
jgi:hypothetical protein